MIFFLNYLKSLQHRVMSNNKDPIKLKIIFSIYAKFQVIELST